LSGNFSSDAHGASAAKQHLQGSGRSSAFSLEETGPRITAFLGKLIADAGFELQFTIEPGDQTNPDFENPDLAVKFTGPDVDLLLGNRAELLLALELVSQEVLRLHSDDHSRIAFDANDYRALRIEELRLSALAAAETVKKRGTPFRFNPMNSRERRVIHIALRNEHELRSESAGAGPFRHVVVYPAGMASLPDPPPPPFVPRDRGFGGGGNRGGDRPGGRGDDRRGRDRRPGGTRPPRSGNR
jgi:spoIIIJ-associated protein